MQNHRSLLAWQRSRACAILVIRLRAKFWRPQLAVVWDQLQRAAHSVFLNIAEGYAHGGAKWVYHLKVAHGSAIEVLDLVDLLKEVAELPEKSQHELMSLAHESGRLVTGLLRRYRRLGPEENGGAQPSPPP